MSKNKRREIKHTMIKYKIILSFLLVLLCNSANAYELLIKNGAVNGVGIGDTKEKISTTFSAKYQIVEEKRSGYMPTINLYQNKKKIAMFSIADNKIVYIDLYDNCITAENIGIGSTLKDALKTYGRGQLASSDQGYLVYFFEKVKKLAFLLDDADIPKELRNIPDDVITEKQEKKIFCLKNVKIKAIKIYGIYGDDGN
jgi:hypothetical protein